MGLRLVATVFGLTASAMILAACAVPATETQKQPGQFLIVYDPDGELEEESTSLAANADDPIICQKQTPTGSRLATREVCARKSQWEQNQARHQNDFEAFVGKATNPGVGN